MVSLIDSLKENDYHGKKLKILLKKVASEGRSVTVNSFSLILLTLILGCKILRGEEMQGTMDSKFFLIKNFDYHFKKLF